ncbi:hypothetical protein CF98_33655 [Halopseudomonas bauzanensis]|nr:hypothetical protein CF98_33655 [Halopseudomonas bauzanensis]
MIVDAKAFVEKVSRSHLDNRFFGMVDSRDNLIKIGSSMVVPHLNDMFHATAEFRPIERLNERLTDCGDPGDASADILDRWRSNRLVQHHFASTDRFRPSKL